MECSRDQLQRVFKGGWAFLGLCNSEADTSSRLVFRGGSGESGLGIVRGCPPSHIHSRCRKAVSRASTAQGRGGWCPVGAEGETWEES